MSIPIVSAIIVSHNSAHELPQCLAALENQSGCSLELIVVDSGSTETGYLDQLADRYAFRLIRTSNVGFSQANNIGYQAVSADSKMVVFLNPDTILPDKYLEKALTLLKNTPEAGVVSGVLVGYDMNSSKPTEYIDSTGVFRKWYGRWYDRDHGVRYAGINRPRQFLPAVCGALLACRPEALAAMSGYIFDPDFFLYKEDIEFSIRLRKHGWKLLFEPQLVAYHGRGWKRKRRDVHVFLREVASKSEMLLYRKHPSPYMLWAVMKYILVRYVKI